MSDTRRGKEANWQNTWPVVGVRRGEPAPSAGVDALRAAGYRVIFDLEAIDVDRDEYQDHLNNTAPVRMFNELRIAYVAGTSLTPDWPRFVRRSGMGVLMREQHVQYDSEGWMHERLVGGTRFAQLRGKAAVVEQQLVEATTGRSLAQGWCLQLLVEFGSGVVAWPEFFGDMVADVEGHAIPVVDDPARTPWGPPDV